jgi:carbonic anhydrase
MKPYEILLNDNKTWAAKKLAEDPGFFDRLLHVQSPNSCGSAVVIVRVPPDQITQTKPGEIFIHRM